MTSLLTSSSVSVNRQCVAHRLLDTNLFLGQSVALNLACLGKFEGRPVAALPSCVP